MLMTFHSPDLSRASGRSSLEGIWFNQWEALSRSGWWHVTSMKFLRSFLRRHFAGKTEWVVALRKVSCFVRLQNNLSGSCPHYRSWSDFRTLTFFVISGNSDIVVDNPACTGEYTFIQFIASAVCHRNPLTTGRYLGIKTTKKQFLQLCEVEVYSRGNGLILWIYLALNQLPNGFCFNRPFHGFFFQHLTWTG